MKTIIGVNRHHNATTTVVQNGKILLSIEEERLNRFKNEGIPFLGILKTKDYIDDFDSIGIAGYAPLGDIQVHGKPQGDLFSFTAGRVFLKKNEFVRNDFWKDHHFTHAVGSFYNSGFEDAICIVMDGSGSKYDNKEESYSSFYINYPNNVKTLTKEYFNISEYHSKNNEKSLGRLYAILTSHFGFDGFYECGKVMGLASYGKKILDIDFYDFFYGNYGDYVNKNHPLYEPTLNMKDFQLSADLAYTLQQYIQNESLKKILLEIEKTNSKNICLSGGFFMNCVNNYHLKKHLPIDINLYVEPIAHDGGTSLGVAKYIYYSLSKDIKKYPQTTTYYGLKYEKKDLLKSIEKEKTKSVTYTEVAELLKQNKIIAIYQGRSEQGPRALGNRSILFNPKNINGKDIVNQVKKREHFRPFGGTILHENMSDYFDMAGLTESPFMCYAVDVKKEKLSEIPAITHVDNTCRIQTLKKEFNPYFYNLINEFYKLTGTPILLNTSFNLAGEPMVETIEDALKTLYNSEIDYLYLPELKLVVEKSYK